MTLMFTGAVLIHTALVGLGAFLQRPAAAAQIEVDVPVDHGDQSSVERDDVQIVTVSNTAPAFIPESSALPPEDAAIGEPLPPMVVPDIPEPSDATPPPKPRHSANRAASLPVGTGPAHAVGNSPGAPDGIWGATAGVQGWKMPKPPYPVALRSAGLQGMTTVRIATDASGNIATVEIVKSAGNALLDRNTQTYVREFWKGPPNAARTTEFVYQLR